MNFCQKKILTEKFVKSDEKLCPSSVPFFTLILPVPTWSEIFWSVSGRFREEVNLKCSIQTARIYLFTILFGKFSTHCPRRFDILSMISCIMNWKGIPGLEVLPTGNAGMVHVEVNFCMSSYLCPVCHCLSTALAGIFSRPTCLADPQNHCIQHTVQI